MLKDKVIVITGGLGLLGREFVSAIVRNQGIAIIADVNEAVGEQVISQLNLEESKANIVFHPLDITSKQSITEMVDVISTRHGRIDALVNNAYPRNKNYGKHFFDVQYNDFCENINLNLGGYFQTSQQLAIYFQKQGHGNIINIASIYGVIAPKFEIYQNTQMSVPVEYAAIKSAIIHLSMYMAKYFKGMNIRVNTLSPGGILDNQPSDFLDAYKSQCLSKGMLDKSDLNGALLFLLSDMSAYVNGQNIVVDDGFSI
jgi:NAD(P)-dependent dehydrogenase (short-subunit alcohol dehydrogenase family)